MYPSLVSAKAATNNKTIFQSSFNAYTNELRQSWKKLEGDMETF